MAKKKSANRTWKLVLYFIIAGILILAGYRLYEYYLEQRAGFIKYEAFGIELPTNYEIHGIDVSKYQEIINWETVKSMDVEGIQIGFAFMKATEGNHNKDRQFRRNWKRSKQAGVPRGAYHFFITTKSGRTQAENFIKEVDLEPGDLPPVLDIENTYGVADATIRKRASEWLLIVEQHYGVKPLIYTNVDFYKHHLGEDFDEYPLWVAHYLQKKKPRILRDWEFWQHSETGRVNGIRGKVDFNVFSGDSTKFRSLLVP